MSGSKCVARPLRWVLFVGRFVARALFLQVWCNRVDLFFECENTCFPWWGYVSSVSFPKEVRNGAFATGFSWWRGVAKETDPQSDIPSNKQVFTGKFHYGKVRTLSTRKDHLCQREN